MADINTLLSLQTVRQKAHLVLDLATKNQLTHFDYHPDRLPATVDYVSSIIQRDFGPDKYNTIPPHGRWQHFNVGSVPRVENLLSQWDFENQDAKEKARRLVDLFFVSVLLDAGAGDVWRFVEPGSDQAYTRSEGIAVASLYMFTEGVFSGGAGHMVTGSALEQFSLEKLYAGFQISENNPLVGAEARVEILQRLGSSLLANEDIFRGGRPGGIVDYLTRNGSQTIDYAELWSTLQKLLIPIWPADRTKIDGQPIGDAWPLSTLSKHPDIDASQTGSIIIPFHKLTQWLAYSLQTPFTRILGTKWDNAGLGTGLPEYRNGGLFVDMGVLTLKPEALAKGLAHASSTDGLSCFTAGGEEIVEWRAMTVALLDLLLDRANARGQFGGASLALPQLLEAGSWKTGREIAAEKRPGSRCSPILNDGDGTLF